jgi:hypothetical protein
VADFIGLVGDLTNTYLADHRINSQTVGVARRCRNHRKSILSILVRKPQVAVDFGGVSRTPSWSMYRHSTLPTLACVVIIRSIFGILRLVSASCDERVSYDASVGQCASPELAIAASDCCYKRL